MTITEVRPPSTEPFLLPEKPPRLGPVSRRLLLRLAATLLSMQTLPGRVPLPDRRWSTDRSPQLLHKRRLRRKCPASLLGVHDK